MSILSCETSLNMHRALFSNFGDLPVLSNKNWNIIAGEPEKGLSQDTFDEIALLLVDSWSNKERIEPGINEELIAQHRKVTKKSDIGSYVSVLPNGRVLTGVLPVIGLHELYFPQTSHIVIEWDPERKEWRSDHYSCFAKYREMEKYSGEVAANRMSLDELFNYVAGVDPKETKFYKTFKAAINAAVLLGQDGKFFMGAMKHFGLFNPDHKVIARKAFDEIPDLPKDLKPTDTEMLEYAMEVAKTVPNIITLNTMLAKRQQRN